MHISIERGGLSKRARKALGRELRSGVEPQVVRQVASAARVIVGNPDNRITFVDLQTARQKVSGAIRI